MPIRINFLPSLGIFVLGIFLGILLISLITLPKMKAAGQDAMQNYGNALATMAAHQAIDASFNHDLVRLQVILRDIVENPQTSLATIHDVENNLLVQAGETRPSVDHENYTAPIVLDDSIAGYVTVVLDKSGQTINPLVTLLVLFQFVLLAIGFWSFYESGAISINFDLSKLKAVLTESIAEEELSEDINADSNFGQINADTADQPVVYALIQVKNLEILRRQLDNQTFQHTFSRMEKVMVDVLALYSGSSYSFQDNYYTLAFNANDATNEALFRAICGAYLIIELTSIINKIPLDLSAFVSTEHDHLKPVAASPFAGLLLEESAAHDEMIQRRLKFMEAGKSDGQLVVAGFKQPFQNLLDNQCKQLSQLI